MRWSAEGAISAPGLFPWEIRRAAPHKRVMLGQALIIIAHFRYIKILTWLRGFLVIFSIFVLVFFVLKSLLGIATQWSHVKFAFMTLKLRSRVFLNTSNLGYFPLTQHHMLVSLVTKPSSLITWIYHKVETTDFVNHIQKVSRKSSWKANGTWLFRSFQLKKLLWPTEFLKR